MIMYANKVKWNNRDPPKVCNSTEFKRVVAPKVIPVKKRKITKGKVHFIFLNKEYAVIMLKIPKTGRVGGAAKPSIAKYPIKIIPTRI